MLFTRIMEHLFHLEPVVCQNCEHLRIMLEQARLERKELIQLATASGVPEQTIPVKDYQPIPSRHMPFSAVRHNLEKKDRLLAEQRRADLKAKANAATSERIDKLEEELGVKEDAG